jgi:hypothetical protein
MSDKLRIGLLTTWNTRCGIAEYSRYIAKELRRHEDEVELVVFGSHNYGDHKVREDEDFVVPVFDVPIWSNGSWQFDPQPILDADLDVLHVQYQMLFYNMAVLTDLLQRFPGVKAITYHDNDFFPEFPYELFDLRYTHREGVGLGESTVIPHGVEDRPPVVKTFGMGRSRDDLIKLVCDRNGWEFEKHYGRKDREWMEADELYAWLRDSDAIVLWYDEAKGAGSSGAVRIAVSTRRFVVCNSTTWFRDMPRSGPNWKKVDTPAELEAVLREQLGNEFVDRDSWRRITDRHLADYREALGRRAPRVQGARDVAVLAFADELIASPELLRAYGEAFDGADEITLVIHAPGTDPDALGERLGPLVEAVGLDGDDAADLLAMPTPATPEHEAILARGVDAVLSRREVAGRLGELPRFDEHGLDALRGLAESRWSRLPA